VGRGRGYGFSPARRGSPSANSARTRAAWSLAWVSDSSFFSRAISASAADFSLRGRLACPSSAPVTQPTATSQRIASSRFESQVRGLGVVVAHARERVAEQGPTRLHPAFVPELGGGAVPHLVWGSRGGQGRCPWGGRRGR